MNVEIGRIDLASRVSKLRHFSHFVEDRVEDTCCRHGRLGFIGIREISLIGAFPRGFKNAIRARIGEATGEKERPEEIDR